MRTDPRAYLRTAQAIYQKTQVASRLRWARYLRYAFFALCFTLRKHLCNTKYYIKATLERRGHSPGHAPWSLSMPGNVSWSRHDVAGELGLHMFVNSNTDQGSSWCWGRGKHIRALCQDWKDWGRESSFWERRRLTFVVWISARSLLVAVERIPKDHVRRPIHVLTVMKYTISMLSVLSDYMP